MIESQLIWTAVGLNGESQLRFFGGGAVEIGFFRGRSFRGDGCRNLERYVIKKQVWDKAEALRIYCKTSNESLRMQNQCAEIKLRAERSARLVGCRVVTADTVPVIIGVYKTIGESRRCFPYMVLLAWVFLQRAPAVCQGKCGARRWCSPLRILPLLPAPSTEPLQSLEYSRLCTGNGKLKSGPVKAKDMFVQDPLLPPEPCEV